MLKPDDKRKVEGARGTTRVKGESYRQGEIYISSLYAELGQMEACYYDACHYITNSSTRYHCGDCCARISKGSNSIENSGGDSDYCWWSEMETECPGQHIPMEHHHIHGCVDYETGNPKAPRERLRRDWGLYRPTIPAAVTTKILTRATTTAAATKIPHAVTTPAHCLPISADRTKTAHHRHHQGRSYSKATTPVTTATTHAKAPTVGRHWSWFNRPPQ